MIGDVDGDSLPDIAITTQDDGNSIDGEVRLFNRNGVMHPHFPEAARDRIGWRSGYR